MPRKLGQHFLKDETTIDVIVHAVRSNTTDVIIEVGPGHGELTFPAARACPAARILAVEKDPTLAETLRYDTKRRGVNNVRIVCGDILRKLPGMVSDIEGDKKYAIIGNIPYYLTGFLFRTIGNLPVKPSITVLTVQKEVAARAAAQPGRMNKFAASIQFWGVPEIIREVPASAFNPPPRVDSAVLTVLPKKDSSSAQESLLYHRTLQALFGHMRKTLLNNACSHIKDPNVKENIARELTAAGIVPNVRPQHLSVKDIMTISRILEHHFRASDVD